MQMVMSITTKINNMQHICLESSSNSQTLFMVIELIVCNQV